MWSLMPILKIDYIAPDGARIVVDWDNMGIGYSIFIPCLESEQALKQVKVVTYRKGFEIVSKQEVHDSKIGLRIWRIA